MAALLSPLTSLGENSKTVMKYLPEYRIGKLIAEEDFSKNLDDWKSEGDVSAEIIDGRLLFEATEKTNIKKGNIWWEKEFKGPFLLEFDYQSDTDYGLSMMFWNAHEQDGKDFLSVKRSGRYEDYVSSSINAYHVSFHRFGSGDSNIRKAPGFHLVATAKDPIPMDSKEVYKIAILTIKNRQLLFVNGKLVHDFIDKGKPCLSDKPWMHKLPCKGTGNFYTHGYIGIRHTQKQKAYYDNIKVYELKENKGE